MEKDRFMNLAKQIKAGERARVLFDMLMEVIEAQPDIKHTEFWECLKVKIMGEQKAIQELTSQQMNGVKPKQVRKKRVKENAFVENEERFRVGSSAQELNLRKEDGQLDLFDD